MLEKGLSALHEHVHRFRLRGSAMIRILTADEPNAITITVDGQLVDDCVDAVETCSYQAMGQGRPVHLFLRDVSHIDEHARSLLSRLAGKAFRLSVSGVYSCFIVEEISKEQPQHYYGRSRSHQEVVRNSRKPASAVPLAQSLSRQRKIAARESATARKSADGL